MVPRNYGITGKCSNLLIYGNLEPSKKQVSTICLKFMIAKVFPEVKWDADAIPIIYILVWQNQI